ncbi:hypothetical protein CYLTODRAFT_407198 [Cylindrobasidium torrendii FP15055 ss-10]|uniref:Uncharacterized protein n=1 Tax=Cylindrobasidium torrendii FP15055 ss-10 TaxID=1314674 RepID=A0A0D7BQ27_9AGAR|nr:hypothetical protein CYLTODRAFT_407198 [Cylindrobasidium torrendii FP15055 ss-10]
MAQADEDRLQLVFERRRSDRETGVLQRDSACAVRAVPLCAAGDILALPTTWQFVGDGSNFIPKPQHSGVKAYNVRYWLYIVYTTEYLDFASTLTDDGDQTTSVHCNNFLPCFPQTNGLQTSEQLQEQLDSCNPYPPPSALQPNDHPPTQILFHHPFRLLGNSNPYPPPSALQPNDHPPTQILFHHPFRLSSSKLKTANCTHCSFTMVNSTTGISQLDALPAEVIYIILAILAGQFRHGSRKYYRQRKSLLSCSQRIRSIVFNIDAFWDTITVQRTDIEAVVLEPADGTPPTVAPRLSWCLQKVRGQLSSLIINAADTAETLVARLSRESDELEEEIRSGKKLDVVLSAILEHHRSGLSSLEVNEGSFYGCGARFMRHIQNRPLASLKVLKISSTSDSEGDWEGLTVIEDEHTTDGDTDLLDGSPTPFPTLQTLEMRGVMNSYDAYTGNIWGVTTLESVSFSEIPADRSPPNLLFLQSLAQSNPRLRRLVLQNAFDHCTVGGTIIIPGVTELDVTVSSYTDEGGADNFIYRATFPDLEHFALKARLPRVAIFPSKSAIIEMAKNLPFRMLKTLHLDGVHPMATAALKARRLRGLERLRLSNTSLSICNLGVQNTKKPLTLRLSALNQHNRPVVGHLTTLEMDIYGPWLPGSPAATQCCDAVSHVLHQLKTYQNLPSVCRTLKNVYMCFHGITPDDEFLSRFGFDFYDDLKHVGIDIIVGQMPFCVEGAFHDEQGNRYRVVDFFALALESAAAYAHLL